LRRRPLNDEIGLSILFKLSPLFNSGGDSGNFWRRLLD
jgi:hypothetical protein